MESSTASLRLCAVLLAAIAAGGCASTPPPRTGFLSDYSRLERIDDNKARWVSPKARQYKAFMVDPVQLRAVKDPPVLTPEERATVANYMHDAFVSVLRDGGYGIESRPGVDVARVRFALTDIKTANALLSLHPASKLTGAGTGNVAMEGEVIDSVTGEQLAAVVKRGSGNQFELDTFDKLDDIKDVIDDWAKEMGERLREIHSSYANGD